MVDPGWCCCACRACLADGVMMESEERRKGPSNSTLSFSGIIAIVGLLASGVATYTVVQNDIATLKRGETYQERVNDQLRGDIKWVQADHRESMQELSKKIDRLIEHSNGRK